MGTHLSVFNKSYPMNTNMTGFRWFSKICVSDNVGQDQSSTQESTLGKIFEETKPLILKLLSGNLAVIDDQLRTQKVWNT